MDQWAIIRRIGTGILRRRKRLALLCFVSTAAVFGTIAYTASNEPPRYRSTATVLLEARPDRLPVFQEFSPVQPLAVQLAILRSRSLSEAVLDILPRSAVQDLLDHSYYVDYLQSLKNLYRRWAGIPIEVESTQRRALIELQQARMKFDPKTEGIVEITAEASRPQMAMDIANSYVEAMLARTRSFNIDDARTSREFLEQQLADVKNTLSAGEDALRRFTASHGGMKIPERSQATAAQLTEAETALSEMEANRRMLQARLQALRAKVDSQKAFEPAAASSAPRTAPPEIQRLRAQLAQLETALLELRTKYTDAHPRIVLVRDRIAEVQRQLGDAVKETTPTTPAAGAVPPGERINFAEQVVSMETALHVLEAQEDAVKQRVGGLRQSLSGLSRGEAEYGRLLRDVESQRSLHTLLADKLTAARIREQGEMKVVKIIDPAGYAIPVTGEKRLKLLAVALLLAVAIGGGVPATVEWLQRRVETEEDIESIGLPVLAVVPHVATHRPRFFSGAQNRHLKSVDEAFMFSEALRGLRVAIQLRGRQENLHTLMITSASPAEGKSTVVANLGRAFAEAGVQVVVADTDFEQPTLHRVLDVKPVTTGVADALRGEHEITTALVPVGERMRVAPGGTSLAPQSRGILATGRLKAVMDDIGRQAEIVLCDSPPVLLIPDNLFVAAQTDGVILVAKAGSTTCRELARAKALLEGVGAKPLGVVINEVPAAVLRRQYNRYYRTYYRGPADERDIRGSAGRS